MQIVDFISRERLSTFEKLTEKQERAIALHNHTLQLGSSVMSMIALFELSLRNSTNHQLVNEFGDEEWLLPGHSTVPLRPSEVRAATNAHKLAQKAAYAKLSHKEKGWLDAFAFPSGMPNGLSHENKVRKRQRLFVVSHGQVISQTTFHFWKRLYSHDYDGILWKKALKRVFPNKKVKRSQVAAALETTYATRNRVAHHEPMYGQRLADAIQSLEFLRDTLGARKGEEATSFKEFSRVQHLRLRMDYESFLEAWRTLT